MSFQLKLCVKAEEKFMKKVLVVLAIVAYVRQYRPGRDGQLSAAGYNGSVSGANCVGGLGWSSGSTRTISWSGSATCVNGVWPCYLWVGNKPARRILHREKRRVLAAAHIVPVREISPCMQIPVTDLTLPAVGLLHSTIAAVMAQAAKIWASTITAGAV